MAKVRPILIQIWEDRHFQEFTTTEKLIFISLFTNNFTTESGVYYCTFKTIRNITDIPKKEVKTAILETFKEKVVYDSQNSVIWVKNFLRYNGAGNPTNVIRSIMKDFKHTKRSSVWDEYWKYNGRVIEKLIKKSQSLQKELLEGKVSLPKEFINCCPSVNQYLPNNKPNLKIC